MFPHRKITNDRIENKQREGFTTSYSMLGYSDSIIACTVLVGHAILREGNGFIILHTEESVPTKCTIVTASMIKHFCTHTFMQD